MISAQKTGIRFVLGMLILGLLTGCSGLKTYRSDLDKNLRITTETKSGSLFSSVEAALDIHRVKPDCSTEYVGTVQLDQPDIEVGIPQGQPSYLVFVFGSSSFLGATSGTISYDVLLKPHVGHQYHAEVSYLEDIYNVEIFSVSPGGRQLLEMETMNMSDCQQL